MLARTGSGGVNHHLLGANRRALHGVGRGDQHVGLTEQGFDRLTGMTAEALG
ncbi:hypothetical protein G7L32_26760, partial [Klebsiella quasipneumoniae]|nr:hypothetical protein [Klebsiella quasipneumoniae]